MEEHLRNRLGCFSWCPGAHCNPHPSCHRCSLLLLFLYSLINSSHNKLCWGDSWTLPVHLQQRKQTYFCWNLGNLCCWLWTRVVGAHRLMAHRASRTWASECTRLLLWALSLALYLPSFLFLGGSAMEINSGFALNYSSLYKTGACPVWLHFTRSWLPSQCQVELGWHDTSLSTQIHVSPGLSMMLIPEQWNLTLFRVSSDKGIRNKGAFHQTLRGVG